MFIIAEGRNYDIPRTPSAILPSGRLVHPATFCQPPFSHVPLPVWQYTSLALQVPAVVKPTFNFVYCD